MKNKVLVIEDEVLLSKALQKKLSRDHLEVIVAQNGQEGLEKALQLKPDLILLDLMMPVINGLTMLAKLKEDAWGKTAVVVILTNLENSATTEQVKKMDVDGYLIKSNLKIDEIVELVQKKLSES